MAEINSLLISISILLLLYSANSEQDDVKLSLVAFLQKLSPSNPEISQNLRWNASTDPCIDSWGGVVCNNHTNSVRKIILEGLSLNGSIYAALLCKARSLNVVSLQFNAIQGNLPPEISNCSQLTHLLLKGNLLSGNLPSSLASLKNIKRFDISDNLFSDKVPEGLAEISGLITFLAQNNKLNGSIPDFDFAHLQQFNVSNNLFTGPVPTDGNRFGLSSYSGNPGLCGKPFDRTCPPPIPTPTPNSGDKRPNKNGKTVIIFSGYIVLGLLIILFIVYKLVHYRKKTGNKKEPSDSSSGQKGNKSEFSISSSNESAIAASSTSLIVLRDLAANLKFEELLKASAELLGRGKHGSLYKVMMSDGRLLAVKRVKDRSVSGKEFHRRMELLDRFKHRGVLSAAAFYCSKQEKLVVYEFMPNGSLFDLLHGTQEGNTYDWSTRLNAASKIAEALAFMHEEAGFGHGNLKSSNILMNYNNEPSISEYGLLHSKSLGTDLALKDDVFSFGVILLELLTGKTVRNNGLDLAQWVDSVVREEWTVEVFDKELVSQYENEDSMVKLLQVALKCIDSNVDARPHMRQTVKMIYTIKEAENESIVSVSD